MITLGSKITEGTYSVTYKEKTVEVATKDETLTELKTVGSDFAVYTRYNNNDSIASPNGAFTAKKDSSNVAARIEYQALNQYGEKMAAEITNVTTTFGGSADWSEPTARKNGIITVYNINSALGIVGNTGKIIIVSKTGVSTANEVTFSEEAKVAKIELLGIYNQSTGEYVDAIPAEVLNVSDYVLTINIFDQYGNNVNAEANVMLHNQAITQAQVLTTVSVVDNAGKLDKNMSFGTIQINDEDQLALKLQSKDSLGATCKTKAGTVQIIIVGDRFGSVMNETISVKQINLLKSFTINATDAIYAEDKNVLEFTAIDTEGNEVTDYKTLKQLVNFTPSNGLDTLQFEKQTDGTAKLVYVPAAVGTLGNDNLKETTVRSLTVSCNDTISPADTVVSTKTFSVNEVKQPVSIVKYTGNVVTTGNTLSLMKDYFVFEDQYGNTLKSTDTKYAGLSVDYRVDTISASGTTTPGAPAADSFSAMDVTYGTYPSINVSVSAGNTYKVYMGIENTCDTNSAFDVDKAQVVLTLKKVDSMYATGIKATWNGNGDQWYVSTNQTTSGVTAGLFKFTGTVNGKSIRIPDTQVSIKSDSYKPIPASEKETAVRDAEVVFTVLLKDAEGKEYTEEVTATYTYSSKASYIYGFGSNYDWYGTTSTIALGRITADTITASELKDYFSVYDQYGNSLDDSKLSLKISLGKNTEDKLDVTKNNQTGATIVPVSGAAFTTGPVSSGSEYYFTVVATEPTTGKVSTQKFVVDYVASANERTDYAAFLGLNAYTTRTYSQLENAVQTANANGSCTAAVVNYASGTYVLVEATFAWGTEYFEFYNISDAATNATENDSLLS